MPSDYSEVNYARTFLSQVIIRADFMDFIDSAFLFQEGKINTIRMAFPHVTMRQVVRFNDVNVLLQNGQPQTQSVTREGFQQTFMDRDGNKLILSNKFIVLEVNHYTNFETTREMIGNALRSIIGEADINVSRLGIRYVNLFDSGRIRLSKSFFNTEVRALYNPSASSEEDPLKCVRSMCLNEYRVGDMRLNFRYGMYNPQYPNIMRDQSFTLDYDCYCDSILCGYDVLMSHINRGHDEIQALFEASITDTLRERMRNA